MLYKYLTILIIFFSLIPLIVFPQTYVDDTLAVRAILDSNGLDTVSVDSVSDSIAGNIYRLDLNERGINTLPSEIGKLTTLKHLMAFSNELQKIPPEIENLTKLEGLIFFFYHFILLHV